jgi:hypothetical protein
VVITHTSPRGPGSLLAQRHNSSRVKLLQAWLKFRLHTHTHTDRVRLTDLTSVTTSFAELKHRLTGVINCASSAASGHAPLARAFQFRPRSAIFITAGSGRFTAFNVNTRSFDRVYTTGFTQSVVFPTPKDCPTNIGEQESLRGFKVALRSHTSLRRCITEHGNLYCEGA